MASFYQLTNSYGGCSVKRTDHHHWTETKLHGIAYNL